MIAYILVGGKPAYQLHALDLSTLADKPGSPVTVTASHALANGTIMTFNASVQRQRAALLLSAGNIYAAFASFCDFSPDKSRGWVLGWNASNLVPLPANDLTDSLVNKFGFCAGGPKNGKSCTFATAATDCPGGGVCTPYYLSSVWMSGYGIAAESDGDVFFVTGNSDPTRTTYTGTTNIQESVVKMKSDLSAVTSLFTPSDVFPLDQADLDYGSGGLMVVPDQPGPAPDKLAVAAGKKGDLFIMDRTNLGGFHTPNVPKSVVIAECWCGPSYFKGSDGVGRVVSSGGFQAKTWKVNTSASPALTLEGSAPSLTASSQDGGFFTTVSSNGTIANTPIVWAVGRPTGTDNHVTLYAFNGTASGGSLPQLWSGPAGSWPNLGGNANLVPTVANGRVYVASFGQLQIFGLTGGTSAGAGTKRRTETQVTRLAPKSQSTGALYWGVVQSVQGSRISVTLRTGRLLQVDLVEALKQGTTIQPVVGGNVAINGTLRPNGVLAARTMWRAKSKPSWGADRRQ